VDISIEQVNKMTMGTRFLCGNPNREKTTGGNGAKIHYNMSEYKIDLKEHTKITRSIYREKNQSQGANKQQRD